MRVQRLAAALISLVATLAACSGPKPGAVGGKLTISGLDAAPGIVVTLSGPSAGGAITGADGSYRFTDVLPGSYSVSAVGKSTKEGTQLVFVQVKEGEDAKAPDLVFTGLGTLTGKATKGGATGNYGITVFAKSGQSALTDDAGNFTLTGLPVGTAELVAVLPGYSPAQASAAVEYDKATEVPPLTLAAVPQGTLSVQGAAKFANLPKHAGILVTLVGPTGAGALTGDDGRFSFSGLPAGSYTLSVSAPSTREGMRSTSFLLDSATKTLEDLTLTALGDVAGTVLESESTPAAGVRVVAESGSGTVSAPNGKYLLRGLPAGSQTIFFGCDRCGEGNELTVQVRHDTVTTAPNVTLNLVTPTAPTGRITGKVLAGTQPAANVTVQLAGLRNSAATTAPDGSFAFDALPAGAYVVSTAAASTVEGQLSQLVSVGTATVGLSPLVFTPLGEVGGRVTLGTSTGNAGISVVATGSGASALTDDAGNFVLRGVATGTREIVASYPGYTASRNSLSVEWAVRATLSPVTLARTPVNQQTGTLGGRVVLTGVAIVAGIQVTATGPNGAGSAVTNDAGQYSFQGLQVGDYVLSAVAPGTVERVQSVKLSLAATGTTAPDLTFSALGDVKGTVTLGTSSGNGGIMVAVAGTGAATLTDDAGSYTLRGVPAGQRDLVASAAGFLSGKVSVQIGWNQLASAQPLTLQRPTTQPATGSVGGKALLGTGADSNAGLVVSLGGATTATAITANDGSYAFSAVPAGDYTLSVAAASTLERVVSTKVTVGTSAVAVPAISLTPLGDVTGRVQLGTQTAGNAGIQVMTQSGNTLTFTDDAGNYTLRGVPAGAQTVSATRSGWTSQTTTITVPYRSSVTANTITLSPVQTLNFTLSGVVQLTGAASSGHAGTQVAIDGTTLKATTASDGAFQLANVPDNVLTLSLSNGAFKESVPGVVLSSSGRTLLLDGYLFPMPTIQLPRATHLLTDAWAEPGILSPDGQKAGISTSSGIMMVSGFTGTPAFTSMGSAMPLWSAFTSNSSKLLLLFPDPYPYAGPGTCSLRVFDVASGQTRTLAQTADCRGFSMMQTTPQLSPNDAFVAFVSPQNKVSWVDLASGRITANDMPMPNERLLITPDSRAILAVNTMGGQVRSITVSSGAETYLGMSYDLNAGSFSPDGTRLVLRDSMGIRRVTSPWTSSQLVPGTESAACCGPARLTNDNQRLVVFAGDRVEVRDAQSGAKLTETPAGTVNMADPAITWLDNNNRVFFRSPGIGSLQTMVTQPPFTSTDLGSASDYQLGAASTRWVARRIPVDATFSEHIIQVTDFLTRTSYQVTPSGLDRVGPDFFTSRDGTRVVLRPTTGTSAGQVLVWTPDYVENLGAGETRNAVLSPSGNFVAFVGADGTLRIHKFANRTTTTVMERVGGSQLLWAGEQGLLVGRQGMQAPLRFQNGLYFAPAP